MASDDSGEEALSNSFWYEMNEVYTSMPCIVVEIVDNLKEQRINVQPCINKLLLDGTTQARSVISNVPVIFPSTNTSAITMPVNKGDIVWCNFSMRAMEIFSESDGKPSTPNNRAKFDQKDAVAFIGMNTRKTAVNNTNKRTLPHSTKDLAITHNLGKSSEVEIRFKPNGDMIITSPAKVTVNTVDAEVNASGSASITSPQLTVDVPVTTWTGDINLTGNMTQSGNNTVVGNLTQTGAVAITGAVTATSVSAPTITAAGKSLSTHTHNVLETNNTAVAHPTLPPN